ncbi:histone methylation protein DOT1-domain-containing protein, partial [Mycena alexandri]
LREQPANYFIQSVQSWTTGIPKSVLFRILEEAYHCCVVPHLNMLNKTGPDPSLAYGELKPSLIHEIMTLAEVTEHSQIIDLGSGVGNVVVHASLQTGCRSYGLEINLFAAKIATEHVATLHTRSKMWGVKPGSMEVECGDMRTSSRLQELLPQADVVFVNNQNFDGDLNNCVFGMLKILKDGARVVSLKPLGMSMHAAVTDRDARSSIPCCITMHTYLPDDITWAHHTAGGHYYLHRIDHKEHRKIITHFDVRASVRKGIL